MERERILRTLRAELAAAQHRRNEAAQLFGEVIRDVPSGLPIPDGAERIRSASRNYRRTQIEAVSAFVRLNEFIIHGTIPAKLGRKPPANQ